MASLFPVFRPCSVTSVFLAVMILATFGDISANAQTKHSLIRGANAGMFFHIEGGHWEFDNVLFLYAKKSILEDPEELLQSLIVRDVCPTLISYGIVRHISVYTVKLLSKTKKRPQGVWRKLAHAHCNLKPPEPTFTK